MRGNFEPVAWKRLICNNPSPPKCIFIGWLVVLRRLATRDRLLKIGIACDPVCCLWEQEHEDIDHLFFDCSWSAAIWNRVLAWVGLDRHACRWDDELDFVVSFAAGNLAEHQVYRLALFTTVYFVWRARNQKKFQTRIPDSAILFKEIQLVVFSRCFMLKKLRKTSHEL
ncbi:uncharacterized protein [Spinacia oleracea]|uniref:Reverse transcriptase zinc-binding domain-containing protein n=1 Tax=Spinacia oleracea TaxID=3562 RepID=A0ABM3R8Z3_SPIOL|nr:uncharacterized protein LOC130467568 [Spinacia oleracea]